MSAVAAGATLRARCRWPAFMIGSVVAINGAGFRSSGRHRHSVPAVLTLAVTEEVQGVTLDFEPVDVSYHVLDTLDTRVAEFHHMMTIETNQMVMLPVPVGCFVLGLALTELVPDHQIALQKKIERIVDGGPAD